MFRIENYSHESERRGENGKKAKDKKGYLTRREVALVHIAVTTNFFSEMMFKNIGVEYLTRGGVPLHIALITTLTVPRFNTVL